MFETWISVIGSLASIGAALWSFREARKSISAATKAERVRNELIHRRELIEVSRVYAETSRILKEVSRVGPSCNAGLLRGVNCGSIAQEVQAYAQYLNEHSSTFDTDFESKANELCQDLRGDIVALAEAKSFEEKKAAGSNIYYKIDSFMPFIKKFSDSHKENLSAD